MDTGFTWLLHVLNFFPHIELCLKGTSLTMLPIVTIVCFPCIYLCHKFNVTNYMPCLMFLPCLVNIVEMHTMCL